jgi:SAM-dependent methyltransferase
VSLTLLRLKALADPTRLRLVSVLGRHELAVSEILRVLDMGQSRVSRHLTILAHAGLLASRRDGLWVYYRAESQGDVRPLLDVVESLKAADPEEAATADADARRAELVVAERTATTRRFFDDRAGEWESLARDVLGELDLAASVGEVLDGLRPRPEVAVDVGCGTGTLLEAIAPRAGRTIGVDSSPRMLERARRRFDGREGVELRLGEAEHLPLRDGEAGLVVVSMTLHHLAEPAAGLAEIARTTARGGRLLLVELERHDREDLRDAHGDRWLGFDRAALIDLARGAGFTLETDHAHELPRGLVLGMYLFRKTTDGGKRNGQRKDIRGS